MPVVHVKYGQLRDVPADDAVGAEAALTKPSVEVVRLWWLLLVWLPADERAFARIGI